MQRQLTKSVAVLPFVNRSNDAEHEYFSDGMTEEIINALSKVKEIKVTSRTSSFFFKDKELPIKQIGEQLGVSAILEGSIRLSAQKMRISAQLIDVSEDYPFWSEKFDRDLDDIFAVQDEISLLIADRLREHLGHFELEDQLVDQPRLSVAQYQQYLRARYHLLKMSSADIQKGLAILEEVMEQEVTSPLVYLGMHLGYTLLGSMGLMPAEESFVKGKGFLDQAIALDPNLAECQLHMAFDSFLLAWDLPASYEHLRRALEIRPMVDIYQTFTSIIVAEGNYEAAMHYIQQAIQIDPFSSINYHLKGFVQYCQEKYEEALLSFEEVWKLKTDAKVPVLYKGQALLLMGKPQAALAYFDQLPAHLDGDLNREAGLAMTYATLGQIEQAEHYVALIKNAMDSPLKERAIYHLIHCYTTLKRPDLALNWLEKAVELHLPLIIYFYVEPILRPLHKETRFQAVMRQILGDKPSFDFQKRKYKKSLLDPALLDQYKKQLEQLMQEQEPYLDPALSLRTLAEKMSIPPNQLSQLLNAGFDQNFSEYVNGYRLWAFKEKANDPSLRHLTILALAFDSGFNSKTVFNTFFKKSMGMTPSAYWKKIVNA
ncbi:MAG: helix-turn-helix domain-containing protein [Saprospiraceae bacterium]|nr:helix-turn-helix domain-containing protein [Saprospiraceae bacterium]